MKLSYREKIGLLIFLVIVLIIVFIALPIKSLRKNIKENTEIKNDIQVDYDLKQSQIAEIPTIESNITKLYNESKGLSEPFYAHAENLEIDKYFEELLNKEPYKKGGKPELEIFGAYSISDADANDLDFYYYEPDVIVYPILEAADTNGNLLEVTDAELYKKAVNAMQMDELEAQSIEIHKAQVPMRFKKEALLALEDELKEKETGIRITAVTIGDYKFGALEQVPDKKGYSEGNVEFEFYTMQQIQEPKFD